MNKVALGLVFLVLAIWGAISWWWFLWDVLKGVFVIASFTLGLILVGLGVKGIGWPDSAKSSEKK